MLVRSDKIKRAAGANPQDTKSKAHSAGFTRSASRKDGAVMVWRLMCSCYPACDAIREYPGNGYGDPDPMVKQIRGEGWRVDYGKPALCPDHAPKKHKETPMPVDAHEHHRVPHPNDSFGTPDPTPITDLITAAGLPLRDPPAPFPLAPAPPPQPDLKLTYAVMNLLEEVFDKEKRLYRPMWNDKRVAAETGASKVYVVLVRRQVFGELAQDPAMQNMEAELLRIGADLKVMADKYAELERRYQHLGTKFEQYNVTRAT